MSAVPTPSGIIVRNHSRSGSVCYDKHMFKKESRGMRWVIMCGVPLMVFVAFCVGLWYGFTISQQQFEAYQTQEQHTTAELLVSVLHQVEGRTGQPAASQPPQTP